MFSPPINAPNAVSTTAAAINDLSQIAGFYIDASGAMHGLVFNNGINNAGDLTLGSRWTPPAIRMAG